MRNLKTPVSLVLSSGGARGMAHIGIIEALEENGFEIKAIAGCSIGSVIGGIHAAGKLQEFKSWLLELDKIDVFKLMDFTIGNQGFIKGDKVFTEINKFINGLNIEDLRIPFSAVAVDVFNQKEVVFSKGNLKDSIRASVSIPSVLMPFIYNDTLLIDGSVLNPLPLDLVKRSNNELLVAVDLNSFIPKDTYKKKKKSKKQKKKEENSILKSLEFKEKWDSIFPPNKREKNREKLGYLSILDRSFDMMQNKISQQSLKKYKPDIVVKISKNACGTFDYYKGNEMIKLGRLAFNEALKKYDLKVINQYRQNFG